MERMRIEFLYVGEVGPIVASITNPGHVQICNYKDPRREDSWNFNIPDGGSIEITYGDLDGSTVDVS